MEPRSAFEGSKTESGREVTRGQPAETAETAEASDVMSDSGSEVHSDADFIDVDSDRDMDIESVTDV